MDRLREKQLFRQSEVAHAHSNKSLEGIIVEIEGEPEPRSDLLQFALARAAFQLRLREGNGNYQPAA